MCLCASICVSLLSCKCYNNWYALFLHISYGHKSGQSSRYEVSMKNVSDQCKNEDNRVTVLLPEYEYIHFNPIALRTVRLYRVLAILSAIEFNLAPRILSKIKLL